MTIAGPFGTYDWLTWPARLVYWAAVSGAGLGLALLLRQGLQYCIQRGTPRWQCDGLYAGGFAGGFFPLVYGITWLMPADMPEPVSMGQIAFIALGLPVSLVLLRTVFQPERESGTNVEPAQPRLLTRLEPEQHGDVLRLSVRDHYVDVVTTAGQTALLMRFSDALKETDGLDGLRVHRSHWVAAQAVERVERDRSKLYVRLSDGARIPVSRTYRDAVDTRWPNGSDVT